MPDRTNAADVIAILVKGGLGAAPFVGALVAEVVGSLIPNQRVDRIARLLKALEEKLQDLERDRVKQRFTEPGFVDLLEDGMIQASRALSEERVSYIASLLKNGLQAEDAKVLEHKHLLSILGELNNAEIIILRAYGEHPALNKEFYATHDAILRPRSSSIGLPQEQIDEAAIHESYRNHLLRLGLLDDTGRSKQLTTLGRLLLRTIDFAPSR